MDIGLWMVVIISSLIVPSVIALILCLVLIKIAINSEFELYEIKGD